MARVLHYRLYGLAEHRIDPIHEEFDLLARARTWRCGKPWIASSQSRGLFEMEYFRHLKNDEGRTLSAAGFVKMAGDETDALIITIFMRDLSAEYKVRTSIRDEDHPLAKLRRLDFESGRLPRGQSLEDVLAKRPVIKKVEGERIFFYPLVHEAGIVEPVAEPRMGLRPVWHEGVRPDPARSRAGGAQDPPRYRSPGRLSLMAR